MKIYLAAAFVALAATPAMASHSNLNFNVNIGGPPMVVAPLSPRAELVSYPAPPQVVFEAQPNFIFSPSLGFYVSVGVPNDIVFIDGSYYLYNNGYWYVSPTVRGPWAASRFRMLPPGLRKYRYEQIRHFRDVEYRHYMRDRDHYRGRWHRPEGEWRDHRGGEDDGDHRGGHEGEGDHRGGHEGEGRGDHRDGRR
jgi:hypothetical protein